MAFAIIMYKCVHFVIHESMLMLKCMCMFFMVCVRCMRCMFPLGFFFWKHRTKFVHIKCTLFQSGIQNINMFLDIQNFIFFKNDILKNKLEIVFNEKNNLSTSFEKMKKDFEKYKTSCKGKKPYFYL